MPQQTDIQNLITEKLRRLHLLKNKEARYGYNTPPEVLLEIEDLEGEIARLQFELKQRDFYPFQQSLSVQVTQVTILLDRNIREFTSSERENFISTLSNIVNISPNQIQILRVESGSILVTLEMPNDAALKLLSMYLGDASELKSLRITKVELHPTTKVVSTSDHIKILFLAANPTDTTRLRLDEEIRAIDQALHLAEFRDKFDIRQQWAVRIADLQGYLLRHKPDIVHFSGHGNSSNEIILEDNYGNSSPVSARVLSQLFSVLKDNIRCVILNACYSEDQARTIAKYIDCIVGMSGAIGDSSAISFASAFYQALGYGRDVATAFELGCIQIDLENLNEEDTPKLLAINSNPGEITFVQGIKKSGLGLTYARETLSAESQSSKTEYRADRIRYWRQAIEAFDFANERFGDAVWYSEVRPHLKPSIVKKIEAPRTFIVPSEGRGEFAIKHILLDEISRLEINWGLI